MYRIQWLKDCSYYTGTSRGGLYLWGEKAKAKAMTGQQVENLIKTTHWTDKDVRVEQCE